MRLKKVIIVRCVVIFKSARTHVSAIQNILMEREIEEMAAGGENLKWQSLMRLKQGSVSENGIYFHDIWRNVLTQF